MDFRSYPKPDELDVTHQEYPGLQANMRPPPATEFKGYKAAGKLDGKVAVITGGDSGIGQAIAAAYAMEGADVAVVYNLSTDDAEATRELVERGGRNCHLIQSDVTDPRLCRDAVKETMSRFGRLNIVVNNASYAKVCVNLEDVTDEEFELTFRTNVFGPFYMAKAAVPHLTEGDSIIFTSSVGGKYGFKPMIAYSSTKGAINALTLAMSKSLGERGIRVNAVLPGAVWTPMVLAVNPPEALQQLPQTIEQLCALKRIGQPEELATAFVYLASDDASYVTGSLFEVHGGPAEHS